MNGENYIGVDIGSSRVKAAQVRAGDAGLEIAALEECPVTSWQDDELITAIKKVVPPGSGGVVTSAGEGGLVSRIVRFPQMEKKELDAAVRHEMEILLPSFKKMIVRYVHLDSAQPGQAARDLLLLAVRQDTVYRCYELFSRAGVLLAAIDLAAFALWRLFGSGTLDSRAIIDMGTKFTTIMVLKNGVIRLFKTFPHRNESPQKTIEPADHLSALFNVVGEVHRLLIHYSQQEGVCLEKLIITGGYSSLEGFLEYLRELFGLPVIAGSAFLPESEQKDFDPSFAVAVGLAMRGIIR